MGLYAPASSGVELPAWLTPEYAEPPTDADIPAVPPAMNEIKNGRWYPNIPFGQAMAQNVLNNGYLHASAMPFLPVAKTLAEVRIYCAQVGDAARRVRAGIYHDDGGLPGALVTGGQLGSFSGFNTLGWKSLTPNLALAAGRYWYGCVLQDLSGTSPMFRGMSTSSGSYYTHGYSFNDAQLTAWESNGGSLRFSRFFSDDTSQVMPDPWGTPAAYGIGIIPLIISKFS